MIHFYKPNQWNSGCCCSFSYNTNDKSFYVQLLKQLSWDSENGKGKFDTKTRSACKFTPTEIGSFIDCIESGREFSSFHKTPKENTSFSFKPKMKDDRKDGFAFTLTKMPKEGEKKSYSISFGCEFLIFKVTSRPVPKNSHRVFNNFFNLENQSF